MRQTRGFLDTGDKAMIAASSLDRPEATLVPGAYTVIVRGKGDNPTGVGLVEFYRVQ